MSERTKNEHVAVSTDGTVYFLPADKIEAFAKSANRIESAEQLQELLAGADHEKWFQFLDPDRLFRVATDDGALIFTTFMLPDADSEEQRFLRQVPHSVAAKCFKKWTKDLKRANRTPSNDRQAGRFASLSWKIEDCDVTAFDYSEQGWEVCEEPPQTVVDHVTIPAPGGADGSNGANGAAPAAPNGTALVTSDAPVRPVGEPKLPFSKGGFFVPQDAIEIRSDFSNQMSSPDELSALLGSKSPEKWYKWCDPKYTWKLVGNEGSSLYTTFAVPGWPDECSILRLIPGPCAEKNLKRWQQKIADNPREGDDQISLNVLFDWKASNCSSAQLNPNANNFEKCASVLETCRERLPKGRGAGDAAATGGGGGGGGGGGEAATPAAAQKRGRAGDPYVTDGMHKSFKWIKTLAVGSAFEVLPARKGFLTVVCYASDNEAEDGDGDF